MINRRNYSAGRMLRLTDICEYLGISRATVWRWVQTMADFPKPIRLSSGITVWDEGELRHWVASKKANNTGNAFCQKEAKND